MVSDFAFRPVILAVMPLYNANRYVEEAVRSIVNQSYSDFGLLIINDGSTDGSEKVVEPFLGRNIILVSQPNKGPGAAMNFAIQFADEREIPFIARMDADDISMPKRFEVLYSLIEKKMNIAACSCNSYYIHSETREIIGSSRVPCSSQLIHWEIFHGMRGLIQGACLFRTNLLKQVGGYRPVFLQAEDTDVFLRLAESFELANSADFLYKIRLNSSSLSLGNIQESIVYQLYAQDCYRRRKANQPELNINSYKATLRGLVQLKIWKEMRVLELWRNYLTRRSYISFIAASVLSPQRVVARVLRQIEKCESS